MSHLSRIKTKLYNVDILQKTLIDLGFSYDLNYDAHNKIDVRIIHEPFTPFTFQYNGQEYILIADLQTWNHNTTINNLIDKITQQYSYNSILEESTKYGFTNTNKIVLSDGSIQLKLWRWN